MNYVQSNQWAQHKIPLSTDNQQHRFEFPLSKGNNSGDSNDEMDLLYVRLSIKLTLLEFKQDDACWL